MGILCSLVWLGLLLLFGRIVLSWFPISPGSLLATVYSVIYSATEPVLGPLRRVIPPIGAGGMGLDLSPTIVIFVLFAIQARVCG